MRILCLDLGTKLGFAVADVTTNEILSDGMYNLGARPGTKKRPAEPPGVRFGNFLNKLSAFKIAYRIERIYFENVVSHPKTNGFKAAHVYGGFYAFLQHWGILHGVPLYPCAIGTIKKHFTGKGKADKDTMIMAAVERGFRPKSSDHADALAIASLAIKMISEEYE